MTKPLTSVTNTVDSMQSLVCDETLQSTHTTTLFHEIISYFHRFVIYFHSIFSEYDKRPAPIQCICNIPVYHNNLVFSLDYK